MKRTLFSVAAATIVALTLAGPASASTYTFAATLTGAQESPPVATNAGGSAVVTFNDVISQVSVMEWFFDLTTPANAAHIHCCTTTPLTGSAPVVVPFTSFPSATTGTYSNTFALGGPAFTSLLNGALA